MSTRSLLSRARKLVQTRGAAGALIIVPLALATHAQANSVPISLDGYTISSASGGFGTVSAELATDKLSIELLGNTETPDLLPPSTYLPARLANQADGIINFSWRGRFGIPTGSPESFTLAFDYHFNFATILSNATSSFGDVSWILNVSVANSPDPYSDPLSPTFTATGSSLTNLVGTKDLDFSEQPRSWLVTFDVHWALPASSDTPHVAVFPDDQLSANAYIGLSLISDAEGTPPSPVPLPPAAWVGGLMLTAFAGSQIRRKRTRSSLNAQAHNCREPTVGWDIP